MLLIFRKDTDIDSGWKIAGKYLFWSVMGALITTALVFGGAPILFGLYGIILGAVAVAGLALGFTALRELKEGTDRPNRGAIKVALGFALAMPVFWLAGVVQGLGVFAIAAASAAVVGITGLSRYFAKRPNDSIEKSSGTLQNQLTALEGELTAVRKASSQREIELEAELTAVREVLSHAATVAELRSSQQAAALETAQSHATAAQEALTAANSKVAELEAKIAALQAELTAVREASSQTEIELEAKLTAVWEVFSEELSLAKTELESALSKNKAASAATVEACVAEFEKENANLRQNLQWLSARLAAHQASGPQTPSSDDGQPMKRSQSMNNLNASHSSVSMFSKTEWLAGPDHPFAAYVDDLLGWVHKIQDGSYAFDTHDAGGNNPIQWALKVMRKLPKQSTEASRAQLGRLWFFIEMHYNHVFASQGDQPPSLKEMIGDILITHPMYRLFFEKNPMDEKHINDFLGERFREVWYATFMSSILNPLLQADDLADDARLAVISCLEKNSHMSNHGMDQCLSEQVLMRCRPSSSDEDDRLHRLFCEWVLSKEYGLSDNQQHLKAMIKKEPAIQDRHGFSLLAGLWEAYANKVVREGDRWNVLAKRSGLKNLNELMLVDPRCIVNPCENQKINVPYFHAELTQSPKTLSYEMPSELAVWLPPYVGNGFDGVLVNREADKACQYAKRIAEKIQEYRSSHPLDHGDALSSPGGAPPSA